MSEKVEAGYDLHEKYKFNLQPYVIVDVEHTAQTSYRI